MTNGAKTKSFLETVNRETKDDIINNIASHYGITAAQALEDVTDDEAEHLLDYVTGPLRTGVSVFMRMYGFN
jgi:uncharacterized phage-associated protein